MTLINPSDEWRVDRESTGECSIPECPCHQMAYSDDDKRQDQPPPLWADTATVRAAIADVLDSYPPAITEHLFWQFNPQDESEDQTQIRSLFIDAVIQRITQLQHPPHDYPQLANYCDKHKRLRLSRPTVTECVDCAKEGQR